MLYEQITFFFLSFLFLLQAGCATTESVQVVKSQSYEKPGSYGEPGRCYAKSYMPDVTNEIEEEYFVYTGVAPGNFDLYHEEKIAIYPAHQRWEKRKADGECQSKDPEECLVWCLVEIPEKFVELKIVKDTSVTDNYQVTKIRRIEISEKGGHTEWKEVLCPDDVTEDIQDRIKNRLLQEGHLTESQLSDDQAFKEALREYQRLNVLPIGQYDMETLLSLGIKVDSEQ